MKPKTRDNKSFETIRELQKHVPNYSPWILQERSVFPFIFGPSLQSSGTTSLLMIVYNPLQPPHGDNDISRP